MNTLLYGVVIPCFNSETTVIDSIRSVMRQSIPPSKVVIINDGSTDQSERLVEEFIADIPVAILVSTENRGLSSARNLGIELTFDCEYVAFLDADDVWLENKMERQLQLLADNDSVAGVCSDFSVFSEEPKLDGQQHRFYGASERKVLMQTAVIWGSGSAVVLRVGVLEDAALFDVGLNFAEDLDAWCTISERGGWGFIPEKLVFIRQNALSMQGKLPSNPELYLRSYLHILEKWSHKITRIERFLKRYDVVSFMTRIQDKNGLSKMMKNLNQSEIFLTNFPILSSFPILIQKLVVLVVGVVAFVYRRLARVFSRFKYTITSGLRAKQ